MHAGWGENENIWENLNRALDNHLKSVKTLVLGREIRIWISRLYLSIETGLGEEFWSKIIQAFLRTIQQENIFPNWILW